jgi:tRNA pseudouridine38-40 synthase
VPRYRVTLAYDGTAFAGWQVQAQSASVRTIQGVVEEALSRLSGGADVRVAGAGRTDAGVHAIGQVAAFDLPASMIPEELARAMNAVLDRNVRVLDARVVGQDYSPRRTARGKLYRYVLDVGAVQLPTRRRHAAHVRFRLDETAVAHAATVFVGTHDFASLASSGGSVQTTLRTVRRSVATFGPTPDMPAGRTLIYEVEGDGFLRKMVRSMVGGLIAVGRGAASVADLGEMLRARDRRRWPAPAEARGLTLVRVDE